MSKRDCRLAQIHQQNQKPKTQPIPIPPKPPIRSRSLSPGKKTMKKQTKKMSFQELYLKGISANANNANNANNENSKNTTNNTNNDTKTNTKLKPKKIIDDTNITPNNNVNMNIFKAAKFRSNELLAVKEFKPNRKDRFSGGSTVFLG